MSVENLIDGFDSPVLEGELDRFLYPPELLALGWEITPRARSGSREEDRPPLNFDEGQEHVGQGASA